MVSLTDVQSSNSRIASSLPPGLVAVFVGATSGIGETSLKQFAKYTTRPRVYFVGRSQEAGDRIKGECQALNPEGEYIFIKADTSLIRNVDSVCKDIKSKEKAVNLLFLSTGTLLSGTKTPEGLHYAASLIYYSRNRFILNLLPLLRQATALRRVVSVLAAGKEGPIDTNDIQAWKVPIVSGLGHGSSLITLSLEALAKQAPDVAFIHDHPGPVKTNLVRGGEGVAIFILSVVIKILGPIVNIPIQECGDRHLFLATSARYPPGPGGESASGVPLADGVAIARGIDGKNGSGVYSVNWEGESSGPKVEALLAKLREEGTVDTVWKDSEKEFKRITEPHVLDQ